MDSKERKSRIKEIIDLIDDLTSEISNGEKDIKTAVDKAYELDSFLGIIGEVDGWDIEELEKNIFVGFIHNTNYIGVREEIEEFKTDLDEYMYELSENRREKIEEKYDELEEVINLFEVNNYETAEEIKDSLFEAISKLKDML